MGLWTPSFKTSQTALTSHFWFYFNSRLFFFFFPGGTCSQFVTNMFNQSRWKVKAAGCCELLFLHMVHLGSSSRAGSRLRGRLHKIEFCCPKEADEVSLPGEAGVISLLPWLGRRFVSVGDLLVPQHSLCLLWDQHSEELCFLGCPKISASEFKHRHPFPFSMPKVPETFAWDGRWGSN